MNSPFAAVIKEPDIIAGKEGASSRYTSEEDAVLVKNSRRGDEYAFTELVRRYSRPIALMIRRMIGSDHEAADLAQTVFLKVFEGLPRFLMNSSFKTWLYKIALNTVLDHRKKVRPQFDDFEVEEIAIRAASPGDRIDTERMKRHVRAVVAELPEKQRLTVELRIYEDLDYREISRILGGSEGSARANFFQGMKTLKEKLSDPR